MLAQQARGKVYAFINRMTLDHDLSEDLTQETLMDLIKALPRLHLNCEESFWSWVYRTAQGKVQHHFRRQGARHTKHRTRVNSEILETMSGKRRAGPAANLWRKETVELILAVMGALKLEYRTVLTLRCLEDQSYSEIAALVGGSQMRAKMSFYRARTALRKQLARKGLKPSHFLGALTVFAAMTSESARSASAIPAITAASAKATVSGAILGAVLTKTALFGVAIVLTLTGTVSILTPENRPGPAGPVPVPVTWQGPGNPQLDNSMRFMGTQPIYWLLREIAASHNPDQDSWRCFVHWPREQDVQFIAAPKNQPQGRMLVIEPDHWVEYRIRSPLRDRPGPEFGFTIRSWGTLPGVYLTDGGRRLQEVSVTHYRGGHARGFMVLGFDLSDTAIGFKVRGIRIVGRDGQGPFGGCGIAAVGVSLAK